MSNETVTINDIQIPVSALKAAGFERKVKQGGRFKPKKGGEYFVFAANGSTCACVSESSALDVDRYAMDNCYRTEAEATAARDKQLALVRVQDKLAELTVEPLDWSDGNKVKHEIYYNHMSEEFERTSVSLHQALNTLHGSEEACDWVIDNMQSDLKLIVGIA